jgi:hypothetical protein
MRYAELSEKWVGAVKTKWSNDHIDLYMDPSRTEFMKLMKEWGTAARALVSTQGNLLFWHMDQALHSEAAMSIEGHAWVPAHLVLYPPGNECSIIINEFENFMWDDDFDDANGGGYKPLLTRVVSTLQANEHLRRIYGTVELWGLAEDRGLDNPYIAITSEWLAANVVKK